jgi:cell division protein FtsI/penicillin-binding protein 2
VHSGILRARHFFVFFFFLFALSFLTVRLAFIQIVNFPFYSSVAKDQHTITIPLEPKRGAIFDREMRVLAVNLNVESVYANPREVASAPAAARSLASILDLDEEVLLERLQRDKGFVWIKRKVAQAEADAVRRAKMKGVELIKESKRFYPNGSLACHVVGTAGIDNNGLEGLELLYDRYLRGSPGWSISSQDGKRRKLRLYKHEYMPPKDGFNLILTIDEVIQNIAERALEEAYEKYDAKGASIIVMDPSNGDVLAMASLPSYDLNKIGNRTPESLRNRAICDFFEPGSIFKVVTASAALEEKAVDLEDRFFCENGEYRVGRRILHDHRPHGVLTFREIVEKSSNIGVVKVAARFGASKMYEYLCRFGFRVPTGIDLPGEVVGMNRDISKWSKVSMFAIPMGQEVTATSIQLVRAISVIANGGLLVQPRMLKEIIDSSGETIKSFAGPVPKRVLSSATAAQMRGVLTGVIENGTGKKAKVNGYSSSGKTGTAQKVESEGVYSHNKFIASFIGFAPSENPRLAIVVCVDEPHPVYYGGDVAAPVFGKVAGAALKYLNTKEPVCVLGEKGNNEVARGPQRR